MVSPLPTPTTESQSRNFIQVDITGAPGCGKSTIAALIGQCLAEAGLAVHVNDEPHGGSGWVEGSESSSGALVSIVCLDLGKNANPQFMAGPDLARILPAPLAQRCHQLLEVGLVPAVIQSAQDIAAHSTPVTIVAGGDQPTAQREQILQRHRKVGGALARDDRE